MRRITLLQMSPPRCPHNSSIESKCQWNLSMKVHKVVMVAVMECREALVGSE